MAQIEGYRSDRQSRAASLPGNLSANAPLLIDICLQTTFSSARLARKICFYRGIIKRYRHIIAGVPAS